MNFHANCIGDEAHEMLRPVFWGKKRKNVSYIICSTLYLVYKELKRANIFNFKGLTTASVDCSGQAFKVKDILS